MKSASDTPAAHDGSAKSSMTPSGSCICTGSGASGLEAEAPLVAAVALDKAGLFSVRSSFESPLLTVSGFTEPQFELCRMMNDVRAS